MRFTQPSSTFLASLIVLLGASAVADDGKPSDDHKSGVVDDIINDLIGARRTVLVVCKFSNRFVLVVSGPGGPSDLENGVVFDQEASTMDGNKVHLDEPKKLKDKWPSLVGQKGAMFMTHDAKSSYIVIMNSKKTSALNMDDATISQVPSIFGSQAIIQNQPMSSSEVLAVYTFGHKSGRVSKFKYSSITESTALNNQNDDNYICTSDKGKIVASKSKCSQPVDWTIQAGYVDDSTFLFFGQDNSVNFFSKSAFDSPGTPAYLTMISAKDFWKSSDSKSSKAFFIVIIVVVVIAILALAIVVCCHCCNKHSKTSKQVHSSFVSKGTKKRRTSSKQTQKRPSRKDSSNKKKKKKTKKYHLKIVGSLVPPSTPRVSPTFEMIRAKYAEEDKKEQQQQQQKKQQQ